MYPQSCFCEEAKIKQHTSSKKELCEIGEKQYYSKFKLKNIFRKIAIGLM